MQKLKLRYVFAVALLLPAAWPLRSACAATFIETTSMVQVSTTVSQPSLIIAGTQWTADVGILFNWSGAGTKPNGEYLLLSSSSTGLSSATANGTARISAGNLESERVWLTNYTGPLYGVMIGTTATPTVSIIRKK